MPRTYSIPWWRSTGEGYLVTAEVSGGSRPARGWSPPESRDVQVTSVEDENGVEHEELVLDADADEAVIAAVLEADDEYAEDQYERRERTEIEPWEREARS